jgi:hypothetical protein
MRGINTDPISGAMEMESDSAINERQIQFLTGLKEYLKSKHFPIEPDRKKYSHAETFALGKAGTMLGAVAQYNATHSELSDQYPNEIRVELVVEGASSVSIDHFEDRIEELSEGFESTLRLTGQKGKRRKLVIRKSIDLSDKGRWPEQFEWIRDNLKKMHGVYSKIKK